MNSRPQLLRLSSTPTSPSPLAPNVLQHSLSGIRAPLTVDSDNECSLSSNSSSSYCSNDGSDYEDLVGGKDELGRALIRPFVVDSVEETGNFKCYVPSRPYVFVSDEELADEMVLRRSGDSRHFLSESEYETSEASVEEEYECSFHDESADLSMPIVQLSVNSDAGSVYSEVVDDDEFSGAVQVLRLKVRSVGGDEDDEDYSEPDNLLEPRVVEDSISVESCGLIGPFSEEDGGTGSVHYAVKDSYSAEVVEDLALLKEGCNENDDGSGLVEESQLLLATEQPAEVNDNVAEGKNGIRLSETVASKGVSMNQDTVLGSNEDMEELHGSFVKTAFTYCAIKDSAKLDFLKASQALGFGIEASESRQIDNSVEFEPSTLLDSDSSVTCTLNQSHSHGIVEANVEELDVGRVELDLKHNSCYNTHSDGGTISLWQCDDENQVIKIAQGTKSLAECCASVSSEKSESMENAMEGNEMQAVDFAERQELCAAEKMYFAKSHDREATEIDLVENKINDNYNSVERASYRIDAAELYEETCGELKPRLDLTPAEVSSSDNLPTKGEWEQVVYHTSLEDESSCDRFHGSGELALDDLVEDAQSGEHESFPAASVALLKAITAESDCNIVLPKCANVSGVFSYQSPAGLGSSPPYLRPAFHRNFLNIHTSLESSSWRERNKFLSEAERKEVEKLVRKLVPSDENSMVEHVLYRLYIAAGRRIDRVFGFNAATDLEAADFENDLGISLNILVFGKTGVGKSATINSIFGAEKTMTNAFEPTTRVIQEITGTIGGVKLRVLDTPGLESSHAKQKYNRKILSSMKKYMKKFPPDVVLYVDRLDTSVREFEDLSLLKSISSSLGSSIWCNAVIVLTHSMCTLMDGPQGLPLSCEELVDTKIRCVKQTIIRAAIDLEAVNSGFLNPVSLVDNNLLHTTNANGESWRSHLLFLCYSMKILSETDPMAQSSRLVNHKNVLGFSVPLVPYFLSPLMASNTHPNMPGDEGIDNVDLVIEVEYVFDSDGLDKDKYDQLPLCKPVRKSQIAKLTNKLRKAYYNEYNYRVKLHQKKQLGEETMNRRDNSENMEAPFEEKAVPFGNDQTAASLSLTKWVGERELECRLRSQVALGRNSKLGFYASFNNESNWEISLKTCSSERLYFTLLGLLPITTTFIRNYMRST